MSAARDQRSTFLKQLDVFRSRLLNLDSTTQSIFFRRVIQKRAFDLALSPEEDAVETLSKALEGSGHAALVRDSSMSQWAAAARVNLTHLSRFTTARYEETGLYELYLGVCWLEGHLEPDNYVRAPLLLIPCRIWTKREGRVQGWYVGFEETLPPVLNVSLLQAIRKARGTKISEDLSEEMQAAIAKARAKDPGDVVPRLNKLAKVFQQLEIKINDDAKPKLEVLAAKTRAGTRDKEIPLALRTYSAIGIFPQASGALFADVEEMIERAEKGETDQGIVDNLLDAPADDPEEIGEVELDKVPARDINTVLSSDPSQDAAIVKSRLAECVVVRGPPGTGKSQVIVNLIADALSRGERVLLCCQKRAALDVVYTRLSEAGLGDAAFLVHDSEQDRPALFAKFQRILARANYAPMSSYSESTESLSNKIDQLTKYLREITTPLWSDVHGVKLYHLYARAKPAVRSQLDIPKNILAQSDSGLHERLAAFERARIGLQKYDIESYPLAVRKTWASLEAVDQTRIEELLTRSQNLLRDPRPRIMVGDTREFASRTSSYLRLHDKWWRFAAPTWWSARAHVERSRTAFGSIPISDWGDASSRGQELQDTVRQLSEFFEATWSNALLTRGTDEVLHDIDRKRLAVVADFYDVRAHDHDRGELDADYSALALECTKKLAPDADWREIVIQEVTLRWIDEAERKNPVLKADPLGKYEQYRAELDRALDAKRHSVVKDIVAAVARRQSTHTLPPGNYHGNKKSSTDWNKLAHEVGKKRNRKTVRALMQAYEWPLSQAAPCWLASPEVVSEIFPLQRKTFDLVIFDEASQLDLERALPVLYRGKRIVIAGDEQQMPPSHYFESSDDEESDESDSMEATKADSLLIAAKRVYGFDYLSWHYRSEFQELIDYSNHAFYDGSLNVAANVQRAPPRPPIQFVTVRGRWENQTNLEEARRAVELLHDQLRASPEKRVSVGIITFNAKQMDAVKDEIERRKLTDAEFRQLYVEAEAGDLDKRPFVRNLENVQGDERDVIIMSVGYGPGRDGTFRKNFGVLTRQGGENYLNVAVTRAKRRVIVCCSFNPDELAVETSKNVGPVRFKQYLQYAKGVHKRETQNVLNIIRELNPNTQVKSAATGPQFDSPFEEAVFNGLTQRGYIVQTQVGLSGYRIDLAIVDPRNPQKYCLGIECDGAAFHSGRSVRERDIARQKFLESRGWTIHRVWSRNWWVNSQAELLKIVARLPPADSKPGALPESERDVGPEEDSEPPAAPDESKPRSLYGTPPQIPARTVRDKPRPTIEGQEPADFAVEPATRVCPRCMSSSFDGTSCAVCRFGNA